MIEERYDPDGKRMDDRLTSSVTMRDVEAALLDKATRKITLHKAGSVFWVRVRGARRRYRVGADGQLQEHPKP